MKVFEVRLEDVEMFTIDFQGQQENVGLTNLSRALTLETGYDITMPPPFPTDADCR